MSCKLLSGDYGQASNPMPWGSMQVPSSRNPSQVLFAPLPGFTSGHMKDENCEDLKSKLAGMEQRIREAREEGRAEGRSEGEAQARHSAQTQIERKLQELAAAVHETSEIRSRLRTQAEADLVRLALAIARKVVARELNADPEAITGLVKAALERMKVQEILRVRIHPEHSRYVTDCLARYGAAQAQIIADPATESGTVVFETSRGSFNASAETQLREIERGLTDRFRGQGL